MTRDLTDDDLDGAIETTQVFGPLREGTAIKVCYAPPVHVATAGQVKEGS